MEVSTLAKSIAKSKVRVMYDLARKMDNTLSFTVGEPDFQTPQCIIDEAKKYLNKGLTHYTPNRGVKSLREAIAEKYSPLIYPIDPGTEVIITIGASEALVAGMLAILNPGDEIIVPSPYFPSYYPQTLIARAVPVFVDTHEENGFMPVAEDIERHITPKTKMILLNAPCNPTGAEIDEKTLREIAAIAIKHDLIVLTDDVYRFIRYTDKPYVTIASLPGMKERTIVVDSFSKTYAMTGWRVGFAIGPAWIIDNMPKTHDVLVSCVNGPYQHAGAYALRCCDDEVARMLEIYRTRKDLIVSGIRSIDGLSCLEPKGTFYLWVNIKQLGVSSDDFAMGLLKSTGAVIVPGSGFGEAGEGYVRITFAASTEMLKDGIERIASYVKKLR